MNYKWLVKDLLTDDERKTFEPIYHTMLLGFKTLFIDDFTENEICDVFNAPNASSPMLITNYHSNKVAIRLATAGSGYWCQWIYQLSHELCHYFIRQRKDKEIILKWIEETVCEAVSLYMLDYFVKNWKSCPLSSQCTDYYKHIETYLENELRQEFSRTLPTCATREKFQEFEDRCQEDRAQRIYERNQLYQVLLKNPKDFACILDYTKFISEDNKLLINFEVWKKRYGENNVIEFFINIQPRLLD